MRFVLIALAAGVLLAQNAQLSGVIRDASGGILSGATVTLTKEDTGVRHSSRTNPEGYYSIPAAQPGVYKIRVSQPGFQTAIRMGAKLDVGQSARIDFTLRLSMMEESVLVTTESDPVASDDSSVGTVIGRGLIDNLPLSGRGLLTLLGVTPGVVITPAGSGESGQFSAAGRRADANYLTIDGISVNDGIQLNGVPGSPTVQQTLGGAVPAYTALGSMQGLVSLEAIEEFRMQTSSSRADVGRMPGAHLAITTRSGTNQFHGGLFEYFRNEALDSNNWFSNQAGQPRGPFRLNDFGGTFGGPIVRNRTFFFVSQEDLRLRHALPEMQFLPTLDARIAVPALLNLLPLPNGPEISPGLATYTVNAPRASSVNSTSVRVDHTFGSSLQFFSRFSRAPSLDSQQHPGALAQSRLSLTSDRITVGLDAMISPVLSNSLRLNHSQVTEDYAIQTEVGLSQYAPPLALPGATSYNLEVLTLGLSIGGDEAIARQRQWNLTDTMSLNHGKHLLQWGADFRALAPTLSATPYRIDSLYTDLPSLASGNIYILSVEQRNPVAMNLSNLSLFAQDSWKIAPRFTLSYGLHWEYNPAPTAGGAMPLFASVNLNDSTIQVAARGSSLWHVGTGNFAPRLGGAYSLRPGLVLRSAAGIYYDLGFGAALETAIAQNTASFFDVSTSASPASLNLAFTPTGPSLLAATKLADGFRTPMSIQWNTTLEQEVAKLGVVSVSYLGSSDHSLLRKELLTLPSLGYVDVFTTRGVASYQAFQTQARSRFNQRLDGIVSFTWAHSIDNSSSDADLFNPAVEWSGSVDRGNSSFDVRRSFTAALSYDLPHLRGWTLSGIYQARTGFPLTVDGLNSYFPPGDETRPDIISGTPIWVPDVNAPTGRELNRAAFSMPPAVRPGTLGRNIIPGFGMSQLDLALQRQFTITERLKAQLRIETFNTFNHPNFGNPDTFLGDPGFGRPTTMLDQFLGAGGPASGLAPALQIGGPRSLQIAVRFRF